MKSFARITWILRMAVRSLPEILIIIVLALAMAYGLLVWPQHISVPPLSAEETCGLVKDGMSLREAVTIIEAKTQPEYEDWNPEAAQLDIDPIDDSFCRIGFKDGLVVSRNVIQQGHTGPY